MSQVINTNVMSLTAQNNLNKSQSALATAMQRLSSGLRINSSADDAAGFAISTRMTTQINGLDTAARNANDAVSLAQTASAALQQITDNLQSIRQLAVQSANASNSDSDRAALDSEVQQRLSEITRVAQQTSFNGRRILDGSFGTAAFQVGANVGDTISIDLSDGTAASQIGAVATVTSTIGSGVFASGLTLTGSGASGLVINGTDITGTFADAQALADGINAAGIQGVSSYLDGNGGLVIQTNGTADENGSASGSVDGLTIAGSGVTGISDGTTAAANSLADADGSGNAMDVKTVAGANDAINRIDAALSSVSSIDSQLGAIQNRFTSAISSAQAVSQNLSASRSRIQDADFAAETAAMSQAQILQQAGVSMLAQANAQPQLVLKLLQ
ncbi:MAG TPA: flagellin [Rhodanobacteraceae bacterium]|nr:flagellin [Rhodanobacteraceae bacterium]